MAGVVVKLSLAQGRLLQQARQDGLAYVSDQRQVTTAERLIELGLAQRASPDTRHIRPTPQGKAGRVRKHYAPRSGRVRGYIWEP